MLLIDASNELSNTCMFIPYVLVVPDKAHTVSDLQLAVYE